MEIIWYGLSCFRLTDRGQTTIITDPYNGKLGLPPLKIKGDVVTISHDAAGHNDESAVTNHQHILTGPGEYEIGGVFITGVATHRDEKTPENILYLFNYGGVTVAHLGDMVKVPTQTQIEALEEVNVLLVPVGGGNSLNAGQAAELVSMLEPNIVIPMHYKIPSLNLELEDVERFLKEMGVTRPEPENSFKITTSSIPEETQIILLEPRI
jgi:L-ascorbate metabolism protein UlaG (beta-lactamase superfamily)